MEELDDKNKINRMRRWMWMYDRVEAHYKRYGDLKAHEEREQSIVDWVNSQSVARRQGRLNEAQIAALDRLGMQGKISREELWIKGMEHLRRFHERCGHINVPSNYVDELDGYPLGKWVSGLRSGRKNKERRLSPERVAELDALGMVWDKKADNYERGLLAAERYKAEHGNLEMPSNYVCEDGFSLGYWLRRQRRERDHLSEEHRRRLEELGIRWEETREWRWNAIYAAAKEYRREHGDLIPPADYECYGIKLRGWLNDQRKKLKRRGTLTPKRRAKLKRLGLR